MKKTIAIMAGTIVMLTSGAALAGDYQSGYGYGTGGYSENPMNVFPSSPESRLAKRSFTYYQGSAEANYSGNRPMRDSEYSPRAGEEMPATKQRKQRSGRSNY